MRQQCGPTDAGTWGVAGWLLGGPIWGLLFGLMRSNRNTMPRGLDYNGDVPKVLYLDLFLAVVAFVIMLVFAGLAFLTPGTENTVAGVCFFVAASASWAAIVHMVRKIYNRGTPADYARWKAAWYCRTCGSVFENN
jgi:hypothetical protein